MPVTWKNNTGSSLAQAKIFNKNNPSTGISEFHNINMDSINGYNPSAYSAQRNAESNFANHKYHNNISNNQLLKLAKKPNSKSKKRSWYNSQTWVPRFRQTKKNVNNPIKFNNSISIGGLIKKK